jgi:hypothetical protein
VSFNVAMLKQMQAEGLDFDAAIRVLEAGERKSDTTNAQRQARHRAKEKTDNAVTITPVTPPNDIDILTPLAEVSEPNGSSPQPRPWALPVGVSLQVWNDLLSNRKRKRLGNTPTAWKAFNDDLARVSLQTGIPPPQLIEQCTAKGWGAIYDPRDNRNERPDTNPTATALARVQSAIRSGGAFN